MDSNIRIFAFFLSLPILLFETLLNLVDIKQSRNFHFCFAIYTKRAPSSLMTPFLAKTSVPCSYLGLLLLPSISVSISFFSPPLSSPLLSSCEVEALLWSYSPTHCLILIFIKFILSQQLCTFVK